MPKSVEVAGVVLHLSGSTPDAEAQLIEAFGGLPASRSKAPMKLVRDPVCGTWVSPRESLGLRAGNTTHYFCSDACRAKFAKGS